MIKLKKILRWLGINLIIGILIPFTYATEKFFSLEGLSKIWDDVLYSFLISCSISGTVGIIEWNLNKVLPWLKVPQKRALAEFLSFTVFGFAAVFMANVLFYSAFGYFENTKAYYSEMVGYSFWPMMIGYLLTIFFLCKAFLFNWRDQAVQMEKMRSERFKGEAQLLKDQLNPHFLFNSLNVLTNMVYEDADKSADYIRKLSKFYRYVLEVQNEELISLERELTFCKSYFLLQQSRFGNEALQLSLDVKEETSKYIPPMALQLLLENCIKHNRIEEGASLVVTISVEQNYLVVRNNLQKRTQPAESTGIGLNNIIERYKHLSEKQVQVLETENAFTVKIPLLTLQVQEA